MASSMSVVDGWVAEGPEHGIMAGFWMKCCRRNCPMRIKMLMICALFQVLNSEIIPIYYFDRSRWVGMMRASIEMAQSKFTTRRMFRQYWQQMYTKERE